MRYNVHTPKILASGLLRVDAGDIRYALSGQGGASLTITQSGLAPIENVSELLYLGPSILDLGNGTVFISGGGGGGGAPLVDHGLLFGRGDDDHLQYFNQARGDERYSLSGNYQPSGNYQTSGNYITITQGHELWMASGYQVPSGNYATVEQGNKLWAASGEYATSAQGNAADTALQDITNENIESLSNVTGSAISGHILGFDGSNWRPATSGNYEASGTFDAGLTIHVNETDPHTQYLREIDAPALYQSSGFLIVGVSGSTQKQNITSIQFNPGSLLTSLGTTVFVSGAAGGGGTFDTIGSGLYEDGATIGFDVAFGDARYAQTSASGLGELHRKYLPSGEILVVDNREQVLVHGSYELDPDSVLDLAGGGELVVLDSAPIRQILQVYRSSTLSGDEYINPGNDSNADGGIIVTRSGSVVGISVVGNVFIGANPSSCDFRVLINGVNTGLQVANLDTSSNGYKTGYSTQAIGLDNFIAGDRLQVFAQPSGSSNYNNINCLIEIVYD